VQQRKSSDGVFPGAEASFEAGTGASSVTETAGFEFCLVFHGVRFQGCALTLKRVPNKTRPPQVDRNNKHSPGRSHNKRIVSESACLSRSRELTIHSGEAGKQSRRQ